jgi:F420-dependent oxidoreductase-like protein
VRLSLALNTVAGYPWDAQIEFARAADRLGYAALWVAEAYGWDAFTQLGCFAAVTNRIALATGAVNVFSRSPALIGQSAATLDRVSAGRCILGLGASGPAVIEWWHGISFHHPLRRLREAVDILRLVLEQKRLNYAGQVFTLPGRIKLAANPPRRRVPVYLATLSPRGLRLTGEIADGWLGAFLSPGHYPAAFRTEFEAGMARRAEGANPLSICICRPVVVTDDRAAGRDAVRAHLAFYIGPLGSPQRNVYARLFVSYGFEAEVARVQQLFLARRREEAVRAVTDEMVDAVSIIGPVQECRRQLADLEALGIDEVALQITLARGGRPEVLAAIEALAPEPPAMPSGVGAR